jgi:hypothetical protein
MAYSHADDSFFIGSDDPHHPRISGRDAAKMIARNRQEIIANELSRLAGEEYLEDIMQHMRHMEVRSIIQIIRSSCRSSANGATE